MWHEGNPPEIGWWPASMCNDLETLRWWDGKTWSIVVRPWCTAKVAAEEAKEKVLPSENSKIRWMERWWQKPLTWHKGPPPEIGWWPASANGCMTTIRWWDGKRWSAGASPDDYAEYAAKRATVKYSGRICSYIEWAERWWVK
jgi:hypothetical protein